MGPELRILHLLIALLSILVTIILTIRDVEQKGLRFEMRIERTPTQQPGPSRSAIAVKRNRERI